MDTFQYKVCSAIMEARNATKRWNILIQQRLPSHILEHARTIRGESPGIRYRISTGSAQKIQ